MKFLKFGDPFSDATCGPIINQRGLEKIEEQVTNAVHGGATVHCGGGVVDQFHFEPTLISNVDSDALCITNETFGPICAIKVRTHGSYTVTHTVTFLFSHLKAKRKRLHCQIGVMLAWRDIFIPAT